MVHTLNVNVNISSHANLSGGPLENRPCDRITHKCHILLNWHTFPIIPWAEDDGSAGQGKLKKESLRTWKVRGTSPAAARHIRWGWFVWFLSHRSKPAVRLPNYKKQESVAFGVLQAWLHPQTSPCTAKIFKERRSAVDGKQLQCVEVRCEILRKLVTDSWLSFNELSSSLYQQKWLTFLPLDM